ncbi:Thioesterase [Cupriavidus oxalaticus]|uniref:hypothetical protein n=1 Tax=Cupriavidus oxalaticus TaxID=96344 RepID=UPI003F738F76
MTGGGALGPAGASETADQGFFVHARFGDEQLMAPEPDTFYVDIETALAVGIVWLNERHPIDPKAMRIASVRRMNNEIIAILIRLRGVPRCGVLAAWMDFKNLRRERTLDKHYRW